jgi:hypothetical protein
MHGQVKLKYEKTKEYTSKYHLYEKVSLKIVPVFGKAHHHGTV